MLNLIRRPLVTEKSSAAGERGVYAFEVDIKASKEDLKVAIEKGFRVKVKSVNTMICRGRFKRGKFGVIAPKYWKKALVRLHPGEKIAIFEGA